MQVDAISQYFEIDTFPSTGEVRLKIRTPVAADDRNTIGTSTVFLIPRELAIEKFTAALALLTA